jgi:hypothetical protein
MNETAITNATVLNYIEDGQLRTFNHLFDDQFDRVYRFIETAFAEGIDDRRGFSQALAQEVRVLADYGSVVGALESVLAPFSR